MKAIERHRQTWQGKSDEWLFERLDNELKQKIEEIHRLLAENEALRQFDVSSSKITKPFKSNLKSFNEHQENLNISDVRQSLSLLKGRIQSLQIDINKIDSETAEGRLKAMYNQVERLLDSINYNVI